MGLPLTCLSGRTVGLGYAYLYGCSIQAPEARGERRFVAGGGNDDTVSAEIDGDGLNLLYTPCSSKRWSLHRSQGGSRCRERGRSPRVRTPPQNLTICRTTDPSARASKPALMSSNASVPLTRRSTGSRPASASAMKRGTSRRGTAEPM